MSQYAETPTLVLTIVMAGDVEQAKQVCRDYCFHVGLCVTVEPTTYIYTGGEEAGIRVGLINYPRFPSDAETLWRNATHLADMLRSALYQHSYSIIGPDKTVWSSNRPAA